jgi:hypothetical protein
MKFQSSRGAIETDVTEGCTRRLYQLYRNIVGVVGFD